jgi:hypothetical protein
VKQPTFFFAKSLTAGACACPTLMHARELAELAALVAIHSPLIVRGSGRIPPSLSERYWTASKCRLDRWLRVLKQLASAAEQPPIPAILCWTRVRPVLEEILASELLTRIWAAAAAAYDHHHDESELEPTARNIFLGHLDARRRLLALLTDGRAIELPLVLELNRLRRRVERWGDMLLAHLADTIAIDEFAFEPARARDFADDLDHESAHSDRRFTCQLMLASLRASFAQGLAERSPNSDLNRRIGSAVLAAIREDLCDSTGLIKSLWIERITTTQDDTQGMIDELIRLDDGHFQRTR